MIYIGDGSVFNEEERNALIRYAISIGTRAKCSTRCLLRPLKMNELNMAFRDKRQSLLQEIKKYDRLISEYEPNVTQLPTSLTEYFGGTPSKQSYTDYCLCQIRNYKKMISQIKKSYHVSVDLMFKSDELLSFHRSLNPRVTFGYSNVLHEECDFALNDSIRQALLTSSLQDVPLGMEGYMRDCGYFQIVRNKERLYYEDLCAYVGDRLILDTVSHEGDCYIAFNEDELAAFSEFENKSDVNAKVIKKIRECTAD